MIEKLAWCLKCYSLTNAIKIIVGVWRKCHLYMYFFFFFKLSLHYLHLHTYHCRWRTLYAYTLRWQTQSPFEIIVLFFYSCAPQIMDNIFMFKWQRLQWNGNCCPILLFYINRNVSVTFSINYTKRCSAWYIIAVIVIVFSPFI